MENGQYPFGYPRARGLSEDTYRTLMAVDACYGRGRLCQRDRGSNQEITRLWRHRIPVLTFMNKLDRDGREPLDPCKNLKKSWHRKHPMNWPIGMGKVGPYDLYNQRLELYKGERFASSKDGDKLSCQQSILREQVKDDIELCKKQWILRRSHPCGWINTSFGSSFLWRFGCRLSFGDFPQVCSRTTRPQEDRWRNGRSFYDKWFQDLSLKLSQHGPSSSWPGRFKVDRNGWTLSVVCQSCSRTGKGAKLSNVTQFMAESRENVSNAAAGDIIGYDTGNLIRLEILWQSGQNKFEFETTANLYRLKSSWKCQERHEAKSSTKGSWAIGARRGYSSSYPTTKQVTCLVLLVNFSLKSLHRMENEYTPKWSWAHKRPFAGSNQKTL